MDGLAEVMWLLKACAPGEWSVDHYAKQIFKIRGEMLPRGGARRCIATIGATTAYENPALDVENEINAQLIVVAVNYLRSHGEAIRELVEAVIAERATRRMGGHEHADATARVTASLAKFTPEGKQG